MNAFLIVLAGTVLFPSVPSSIYLSVVLLVASLSMGLTLVSALMSETIRSLGELRHQQDQFPRFYV